MRPPYRGGIHPGHHQRRSCLVAAAGFVFEHREERRDGNYNWSSPGASPHDISRRFTSRRGFFRAPPGGSRPETKLTQRSSWFVRRTPGIIALLRGRAEHPQAWHRGKEILRVFSGMCHLADSYLGAFCRRAGLRRAPGPASFALGADDRVPSGIRRFFVSRSPFPGEKVVAPVALHRVADGSLKIEPRTGVCAVGDF